MDIRYSTANLLQGKAALTGELLNRNDFSATGMLRSCGSG